MNTWRFVVAGALCFGGAAAVPAAAQERPIQLALVNPIQLVPEGQSIRGVRLNLIYSRNVSVTGFDWGLVNQTTGGRSGGVQWSFVALNDGDFTGWQHAFVTVNRGRANGLETGGFNSAAAMEGVQWGLVNHSRAMSGLQVGLVNYAERMHGVQIGLVNIIKQGGVLPVLPIVNWSF
jgi:hypothetical protein